MKEKQALMLTVTPAKITQKQTLTPIKMLAEKISINANTRNYYDAGKTKTMSMLILTLAEIADKKKILVKQDLNMSDIVHYTKNQDQTTQEIIVL